MKAALISQIRSSLEQRLETLRRAAREAHQAATDPGSRAESKYDTRSLEASYLASGQARQIEELGEALAMFDSLKVVNYGAGQEISAGALVELDIQGERSRFLLVPAAGGMEVGEPDSLVTLITPESSIYQNLLGLREGDRLEQPPARVCALW